MSLTFFGFLIDYISILSLRFLGFIIICYILICVVVIAVGREDDGG